MELELLWDCNRSTTRSSTTFTSRIQRVLLTGMWKNCFGSFGSLCTVRSCNDGLRVSGRTVDVYKKLQPSRLERKFGLRWQCCVGFLSSCQTWIAAVWFLWTKTNERKNDLQDSEEMPKNGPHPQPHDECKQQESF